MKPGKLNPFRLLAILCAGVVLAALPAAAATHCVPAANPGTCDFYYATIQAAIDAAAAAGDTVLVGPGTYPESPNVTKSLLLTSNGGRDVTTIDLQTGPTYLGSLTIVSGTTVVVEGFTILGHDSVCPGLANSNIYLQSGVGDVTVRENRLLVGDSACTNGDDSIGIITTYSPAAPAGSLNVHDNIITPLGATALRAFYVNPGLVDFIFERNLVTGVFGGTAITQAETGLVNENQVDGLGSGAGLGTWGFPDSNDWGHTTFTSNVFIGLSRGVGVFESNDVYFECNLFQDNGNGISILDGFGSVNFDPTTIGMLYNRFKFNTVAGAENAAATPGTVDGEDNYWNSHTGPSGAGPGTGDAVLGDIDFDPWLNASPVKLCRPLAIKLDSLSAEWTEAGVAISWQTLSEQDSAGFRVLRTNALRKENVMEEVTARPIPPTGSDVQGAAYSFVDETATSRQTVRYYLEEIDLRGQVTRYGPVSPERVTPPTREGRRAAR